MVASDRYTLLEQVAEGSTATVFRARDTGSDRIVAVKQLTPSLRSSDVMERFRAEAAVLRSLDDPHVVRLFELVEDADVVWIVEQWVDGVPLDRLLAVHGLLTPEQSTGVLRGALLGLAHAHGRDVVHGDVSTGNVLLDQHGTSMLVDFGLATPVGAAGVRGTPAYLSPEAATGNPLTPRSDVYSAGAVLYTLLTGRPPFRASDATAAVRAHVEEPPPLLEGHGDRFARLVERCLAKEPAARPPDAQAMLAELEDAAKRRFGAGWLARSSVAALVPAATRATASSSAGPAAQAASKDSTVVTGAAVDTGTQPVVAAVAAAAPAADATPETRRGPVRRPRRMMTALAAAGAVTVAVVVGAVAIAATGGDDPEPEPSAAATVETEQPSPTVEPSPSAEPTPTVAPELQDALNGTYAVVQTFTASEFNDQPAGTVRELTWTFAFDCPVTPCSGTVTSASGVVYQVSFDGTRLTGQSRRQEVVSCFDDSGREIGGSATTDFINDLVAQLAVAPGAPATLTGTVAQTGTTVSAVPPCTLDAGSARTSTADIVGRRTV
ncbi:MAG: serine/threonine-protein kinase [Actinomycetes bacterium]